MGCNASKQATGGNIATDERATTNSNNDKATALSPASNSKAKSPRNNQSNPITSSLRRNKSQDDGKIYQLLLNAQQNPAEAKTILPNNVSITSTNASYRHPSHHATPLHVAVKLLDSTATNVPAIIKSLLKAFPNAIFTKDDRGNIPIYYVLTSQSGRWEARAIVLDLLVGTDQTSFTTEYLQRNNLKFGKENEWSALYKAIHSLSDDFDGAGPTVLYIQTLLAACNDTSSVVAKGNASDGDKPLSLLYRRFTRQFDLAEKFFSGDNSRPEVVEHRQKYKTAAGNTWKIIESLLQDGLEADHQEDDDEAPFRTVHCAVQVETPPDLLRYIVETNADDLGMADHTGRLPLHYAAISKPPGDKSRYPAFYTKYVVDELLYKYPEAASFKDNDGNYPLTLAVRSGKHWIGGGLKSLYEAYPEALEQINLDTHDALRNALSLEESTGVTPKDYKNSDIIQDEHHDAIMLVQQKNVEVSEVVTSLWAHEEDPGVQMLGCMALSRMIENADGNPSQILRIAMSAVPAVVNAMKAHGNEQIVQEKACATLQGLAVCDGRREVSFVASGAVAAIVGAMQAHVSDPAVQEQGCGALSQIMKYGGDDRATIVASVSGLTAIVNAMAAHRGIVAVQRNACIALKEMTEFPHANLPDLPRSHLEPLLESARRQFPDECEPVAKILELRLSQ
ncbi:hypothetical protein FisN_14Lh003 [Fistulifera solaris]|uniref:LRRK2 ARM repeat domain-containing protein n=1 Tax=Fistulifera solaris TaxID=1519565 RepID=A0A1Z5KHI2_FISSO|nr:hypothetical protein FisN_14Lh003 [Fistulifera solaris]|eukprot:GAX25696.1 hypothetical protein FisN_14Lh003 [Fistulifera solaris]